MSRHRFSLGNTCTQCGTRFASSDAAEPCTFVRITPVYGRIEMRGFFGLPEFRFYDERGALTKVVPGEWLVTFTG